MLARKHRFHGYHSLDGVYRRGATVRGPVTMLRYLPNPKRSDYRCAVVVSKKVHKSAVTRNRIRRRIYEIVRTEFQPAKPIDLVITVFDEAVADMPADTLQATLTKQLKAIKTTPLV
jgi:ribonuclease P protein component